MILFIFIIALILVIVVLCVIPGYTPLIKDQQGRFFQGSIASLEKVNLGGKEQWILIRGKDITKPVILFLHGGPGISEMGLLRKYTPELEKHFLVVNWDQRGTGKSYAALNPNSAMTINQFVSDVCELTEMLCHRFNQKKIYVVGHSWGSVIGILAVQKNPDLYYAYIGIGQVANMLRNEQVSYEWTLEQAKKANDEGTVKKLNDIGIPPYSGDWQKKLMKQRKYLGKYGGEVYGNSNGVFPLIISSLISATEYNLLDKVNFFRGLFSSIRLLWSELITVNLQEQAPSLKVPIFFLLGKHDFEVPFMLAEKYFEKLEAPRKELIWFESSAHYPNIEENEKFNDLMINNILPATFIQ
jgi:pimeloyl-ACP methyl ester carboxylesterase